MLLTPDGRRVFQNRLDDGSGFCYSAHSYPGAVTLPHWIKLEREGSLITAYHSVDGVSWVLQPDTENPVSYLSSNPRTIHMWETVHIGLALTSHASGTATSAVFSNIQVTGAVTHEWQSADIGCAHPSNCPERLYVTLENSAGKVFTIGHPDPKAVNTSAWTEWRIPLNDLGRMSVDQISKIYIGLGNRRSPVPNGIGRIYIDDIRLVRSEP